tara:strand:+ start:70 stop:879 length:810 start_codon:yes stop_codon:yes gene_type:complete
MLNFFKKKTNKLKVIAQILEVTPSDDLYHSLGKVKGNRQVNDINVSRLKKSIQDNNILHLRPIVVREENNKLTIVDELTIVDGQHRYVAATSLGIPFAIMVDNKPNDLNLINMNTHQRNWGLKDFANYWSQQEETKEVYNTYNKLKKENNVTHSILIAIFNMKSNYKSGSFNFKDGTLLYNSFNQEHIRDRLLKIRRMQKCATNPTFEHNIAGKQQLHGALLEALENSTFDFEKFLHNLQRSNHKFNILHQVSDYKKEIFRIEKKRKTT